MEYYTGKFLIGKAVDGSEPEFRGLVVGVEQKITIITPDNKFRSFTTKDYDSEFINEDGTYKDLGD